MITLLIVVAFVLITSGACSLFEAVLYAIPAGEIEALDQRGLPSGRILKRLRRRIDQPIAAVLSLNTIANTGGGALAGALALGVLGPSRVIYFSILFTLAILLFSEVLPKTIGVVYSRRLATLTARSLQILILIFRPLIALTQLVTRSVWKDQQEHRVSDDEVLALVGLGLRSGDFKADEARVIRNVLALETKTIHDIVTPRPVVFALQVKTTVRTASADPTLKRYSRIPVYDNDAEDLVGVVHKVDILTAMASDKFDLTLDELMRPIHFVIESTSLDQLMRILLEKRRHLMAVLDEFGGLEGIVTLEDVLEELIGHEIVDEYDQIVDLRAFAHERRKNILTKGTLKVVRNEP